MPHYMRMGSIPQKRHTQFRKPDETLYPEQLFGTRGFSGISSLLYHCHLPTEVADFKAIGSLKPEAIREEGLRHRHMKTREFPANGDPISGRTVLMFNDDVSMAFCRPTEPMNYFYKNADGDDLLFIQEGHGRLETMFGTISYHEEDYLVIPRGTIYRLVSESSGSRMFLIEAASSIEIPHRYRNEYGQCLEHSPYCERDFRPPEKLETFDEKGRFEVRIKARGYLNSYFYNYHPFDLIGWDGYVYPWAFNFGDFEPITGSIHQPPPIHQTFEAHNFVVCSFAPRMLDYHPQAVPIPYNHSNLESDEMLFYVNANFGSRRGIEIGSITLHPSGLPHGPQPGAVEASLGAKRTEEKAVMVDTFRPLKITKAALGLEDANYSFSWKPKA